MITAKITPHTLTLSGDPLLLSASVGAASVLVRVAIKANGAAVYEGTLYTNASGNVEVDLKDIVESVVGYPDTATTWAYTPKPGNVTTLAVTVSADGSDPVTLEHKVIYGNLSNSMTAHLAKQGMSMAAYKMNNSLRSNFLLITRTQQASAEYYESELLPVAAIGCGLTLEYRKESYVTTPCVPYMVDFPDKKGTMIQYKNGSYQIGYVSIIVNPDPELGEKYLFEYRNAYGYFERFLACGEREQVLDVTPTSVVAWDASTGQFLPAAYPSEVGFRRTIPTGYLTVSRISAVFALLSSEEIYLIEGKRKERVKVSCSTKLATGGYEPQSLDLVVTPAAPGVALDLSDVEPTIPPVSLADCKAYYNAIGCNNRVGARMVFASLVGHHLINLNNFNYTDQSGWVDDVLLFDGIDDGLSATATPMYFISGSHGTLHMRLSIQQQTALLTGTTNIIRIYSGSVSSWSLVAAGGKLCISTGSNAKIEIGDVADLWGRELCIQVVVKGSTGEIYLDGELVNTAAWAYGVASSYSFAASLRVGHIRDMGLWHRALSATELEILRNYRNYRK